MRVFDGATIGLERVEIVGGSSGLIVLQNSSVNADHLLIRDASVFGVAMREQSRVMLASTSISAHDTLIGVSIAQASAELKEVVIEGALEFGLLMQLASTATLTHGYFSGFGADIHRILIDSSDLDVSGLVMEATNAPAVHCRSSSRCDLRDVYLHPRSEAQADKVALFSDASMFSLERVFVEGWSGPVLLLIAGDRPHVVRDLTLRRVTTLSPLIAMVGGAQASFDRVTLEATTQFVLATAAVSLERFRIAGGHRVGVAIGNELHPGRVSLRRGDVTAAEIGIYAPCDHDYRRLLDQVRVEARSTFDPAHQPTDLGCFFAD